MMGDEELFLRVACDLEDGQMCEFTFEYTLLLTQNAASLGVGALGWRLRGFYVQPLKYEYGEFVAPEPLATRQLRLRRPRRLHAGRHIAGALPAGRAGRSGLCG